MFKMIHHGIIVRRSNIVMVLDLCDSHDMISSSNFQVAKTYCPYQKWWFRARTRTNASFVAAPMLPILLRSIAPPAVTKLSLEVVIE